MDTLEERKQELLNSAILATKILYLLFSGLLLISFNHKICMDALYSGNVILAYSTFFKFLHPVYTSIIMILFVNTKKSEEKEIWTWHNTLELISLLYIFGIIISYGGWYKSYDKLLTVSIILIYAIQFGGKYGYIVAGVVSVTLITPTLIFSKSTQDYHIYFQRDLVLCFNLFLITYIINSFTSIQVEYSEKIKQIANIDGLTGLYNRRYLQESLNLLIKNAKKNNNPLSVIIFDIDYFKKFNDTHGHLEGDRLLIEMGTLLKNFVGDNGIVARYGGEEFVILVPDRSEDKVTFVAEALREKIEKEYFKGQETQPNQNITVSIGVCCYPSITNEPDKLLLLADEALYSSKEAGRNRVTVYKDIK